MANRKTHHNFNTEALRERNRELSILNEVAQALNRQIDLEKALGTALLKVAELLELNTGWVWLLHQASGEPYLAASQNLPPALGKYPNRMTGTCYCLDTFRAGDMEGAANVNVVACSRLKWLEDGTLGLKYHASIPLYAHGTRLGVLNVASTDWRQLTDDELRILYIIGDMLSIAVERARLFARSTELGVLEERNRLAREIHDTLAQGLTAISLRLETADAQLENGAESAAIRASLQKALDITRENLEEARRSVLDLRAAPLEGRDLNNALKDLCHQYSKGHPFQVHYETVGEFPPLPIRTEVGLYRIVQEALSNVKQHAEATEARVQVIFQTKSLRLTINDNGRGFNPQVIGQERFGLVGVNERVKLLGGKLNLQSQSGAGTRLEITIPLEVK